MAITNEELKTWLIELLERYNKKVSGLNSEGEEARIIFLELCADIYIKGYTEGTTVVKDEYTKKILHSMRLIGTYDKDKLQ